MEQKLQQTQAQQQLLSQLRDINGLDHISWWPLALGWWVVLGLVMSVWIAIIFYRRTRAKKEASWQAQIKTLFIELRAEKTTKKKAAMLSELLRRLAIHKYGRQSCAGLEGDEWLSWLTQNDPTNFDWVIEGKIMIEAPYRPDDMAQDDFNFEPLVKAAERWVK